jgi:hypothetical protein
MATFGHAEEDIVKVLFHFARLELQRESSQSEVKPHLSIVLNSVNTPRDAFPQPSQLPEPEGFRLELPDPPPAPLGFRP